MPISRPAFMSVGCWHELAPGHQAVELLGDEQRALGRPAREEQLGLGDVRRDPPERLARRLDDGAALWSFFR
jgi:hypothetical protein